MKKLILLAVIASALFFSCKKNNNSVPDAKNVPGGLGAKGRPALTTDVYVVGSVRAPNAGNAAYLKNGVLHNIPNSGEGYGIAVNGIDVYVAGVTAGPGGQQQATYWKNDTPHYLTYGTKKNFSSNAFGITIDGTDVYVVGDYFDGDRRQNWAMIWKNGVAQNLAYNTFPSSARYVVVKNKKVFVAGYSELDATNTWIVTYWINGAHGRVRTNWAYTTPSGLAVNDRGDFYIAGTGQANGNAAPVATYWLDGVQEHDLSPTDTCGTSNVFLINHDVYVGGVIVHHYNSLNPGIQPCYWKNDVRTTLALVGTNSLEDLAILGSDTYQLSGTTINGYPAALVYKNGAIITQQTNLLPLHMVIVQH